ncbi:MAG: hypothetical protein ABS81_23050 [Pseudonocardia sp. SCN 72-86]|nr:MAG: hypothetical protein ABS81_23050 [Pseudonocardia sp. SCN 72-86]
MVLVVVAFLVGRRLAPPLPGFAPAPRVCGLAALAAHRWARRDGWSAAHVLGLAGGALLTYAWHAFVETPPSPSPSASTSPETSCSAWPRCCSWGSPSG